MVVPERLSAARHLLSLYAQAVWWGQAGGYRSCQHRVILLVLASLRRNEVGTQRPPVFTDIWRGLQCVAFKIYHIEWLYVSRIFMRGRARLKLSSGIRVARRRNVAFSLLILSVSALPVARLMPYLKVSDPSMPMRRYTDA